MASITIVMESYGACDISDFGDGLVALNLQLGELGGGGVLAHDAIFDLVKCQKVTVWFSFTLLNPAFGGFAMRNSTGQVALAGIGLFYLLFCMTTESGAIGQEVGIVNRGRSEGGSQHKPVAGVNRRMFFKAKVGSVIFNRPVGFLVLGELQRPRSVTNLLK
jgi:hypothetical protein